MFKRIFNLVAIGFSGILFLGCTDRDWRLISEDEVRRLLPRYALLSARLQSYGEPDSIRLSTYQQYFKQEGYSLSDWDSSMMYYVKHNMPLYHDFYRLASDSFMVLSQRLQIKYDDRLKRDEYENGLRGYTLDSVNLLNVSATAYQEGDLVNRCFDFKPAQPYVDTEGELSVRLRGILKKLPLNKAFRLELAFHAQDSSQQIKTLMIDKSGDFTLHLSTIPNKPVVRVSGYLRGVCSQDVLWVDSLRFVRRSSPSAVDGTTDENMDDTSIDGALVTDDNPDATEL